MIALDKAYHDAILVVYVYSNSLLDVCKDIYHLYQYRYQDWYIEVFFSTTCIWAPSFTPSISIFALRYRSSLSMHSFSNSFLFFGKQIVDGEKDPRGVVQVCSIIQQVLERFAPQLTPNTINDLFMFINGYFPVTYITPPLVAGNRDVVTSV